MPDLRFPIGEFRFDSETAAEHHETWLNQIEAAPAQLRAAVDGLDAVRLDTPYRPEGWTVRQVVHHLPDSHMNSYIRFKLALTEETPTICGYEQDRWAQLEDGRNGPVELSLDILDTLHGRWIYLLRSLKPVEFERSFMHPEIGPVSLWTNLAYYAWHGRHHIAQITALREREGWSPAG